MWAGLAQSVQRLATGWAVRGSNLGGGEIFRTRPDRPWAPPSLLYNEYGDFPEVKGPGRGVDHPTPSSQSWKKKYSHTSTLPLPLPLQSVLYLRCPYGDILKCLKSKSNLYLLTELLVIGRHFEMKASLLNHCDL